MSVYDELRVAEKRLDAAYKDERRMCANYERKLRNMDLALEKAWVNRQKALESLQIELYQATEWIEGAKASMIISHPPRTEGHTEDVYVIHLNKYKLSAAKDGPYAKGADCVAKAMLIRERAVCNKIRGRKMDTELLGEYAHLVPHPEDSEEHKEKLKDMVVREQEEED